MLGMIAKDEYPVGGITSSAPSRGSVRDMELQKFRLRSVLPPDGGGRAMMTSHSHPCIARYRGSCETQTTFRLVLFSSDSYQTITSLSAAFCCCC